MEREAPITWLMKGKPTVATAQVPAPKSCVTPIKQGQMFGPLDPDRKLPHTATRDMGVASARILQDRSWMGQEDVPLVGPQNLSFNEIAAILSDVLGRAVRYHQVPFDGFKAQLMQRGMSDEFATGYVDMMRAKNEGMDNMAERTSANSAPTTFRQWAEAELKPVVNSPS
jgi:hypothetical protein